MRLVAFRGPRGRPRAPRSRRRRAMKSAAGSRPPGLEAPQTHPSAIPPRRPRRLPSRPRRDVHARSTAQPHGANHPRAERNTAQECLRVRPQSRRHGWPRSEGAAATTRYRDKGITPIRRGAGCLRTAAASALMGSLAAIALSIAAPVDAEPRKPIQRTSTKGRVQQDCHSENGKFWTTRNGSFGCDYPGGSRTSCDAKGSCQTIPLNPTTPHSPPPADANAPDEPAPGSPPPGHQRGPELQGTRAYIHHNGTGVLQMNSEAPQHLPRKRMVIAAVLMAGGLALGLSTAPQALRPSRLTNRSPNAKPRAAPGWAAQTVRRSARRPSAERSSNVMFGGTARTIRWPEQTARVRYYPGPMPRINRRQPLPARSRPPVIPTLPGTAG